jgi:esterase/lipase superfamily enzyme
MALKFSFGRRRGYRSPLVPNIRAFIETNRPPPPRQVDYTKGMPAHLGMMLNDNLNNSTCAAFYHARQVWCFNSSRGRSIDTEPDSTVEELYTLTCGYDPKKGGPGPDGNMQDVLAYLAEQGEPTQGRGKRRKILGFAEVDPDEINHVKTSISEYGCLYVGFDVPQHIIPKDSPPSVVWDVAAKSTIVGSQTAILAGYTDQGLRTICWGRYYTMTWDFLHEYVDEAYAIFDPAWMDGGRQSPGAVAVTNLESKIRAAGRTSADITPGSLDQDHTNLPSDANSDENRTYKVWYGTNRAPIDRSNAMKGFSWNLDSKINYGYCRVFIPKSHRIGSVGSSVFRRMLTLTDDRIRLIDAHIVSHTPYWKTISTNLSFLSTDQRCAVIFIHGYNVSFEEAAIRAAQIGFDLSISGAMAFFSWPSRGKLNPYLKDEAAIEASELLITDFLTEFAEKSGATSLHIIAHSMGNRAVMRAIDRIARNAARKTEKPFGQIILAAADVDLRTFRQFYEAYQVVSKRTTLYVSSIDLAVKASKWLHGYPRVGFTPPTPVFSGIDTINVSNVDLTTLGHGYVAEARGVLSDMHELINSGRAPHERFGLRESKNEQGERYWLIGA